MTPSVRSPAVAGLFYPADPDALARSVDALLAAAPAFAPMSPHTSALTEHTRMLVSPHAGYAYSGAVAARAFARLDGNQFDTAVIVGPSHVDAFAFTSVYDGDAYATPLGVLEVDRELAARLSRAHTSIRASVRGHTLPRGARGERGEHGIEVLLPFLQRRHAGIRIVPVVMGTQDWDASHALGRAIAECADAHRTLVVASSDLSHFHSYADAVARDTAFCETLTHLNPSELHEAVRSGRCEACGAGPVVASLIATEVWCERQCRILERINSGDVTGDHESVVGYAAAVVTSP